MRRISHAFAAFVACALGASSADAAPDLEAQRTALYRDAVRAGAAGRWGEAKERLLAVLAIRPSPRVLFSLAQSEERLGQVASAQADYARALEAAATEGKADVVQAARHARRALAARVPHLRATPTGEGRAASDAKATLDDRAIPLGSAVAVDPGAHRLVVRAPGMRTASVDVRVDEGQQLDVAVPIEPESAPPAVAAPLASAAPAPSTPAAAALPSLSRAVVSSDGAGESPPPDAPPPSSSPQRTVGLVVGGAGVLALGAGVAFGVEALHKHDDAARACPDATCASADGARQWHDAVAAGNVATVAFVIAGVGLTTGALLWLTAPSPRGDGVSVSLGPGAVHLRGAW